MKIIDRVNEELKNAMRNREQLRLNTLRMLKSKILAVDARGNLSDPEVLKLFKTYYGNLQEALDQAKSASRQDIVENLQGEIKIVEEFLPQALSLEETTKLVEQAIAESGARSKKDLGLVMKSAMKLNSQIDGKLAKDLASERLEN